MVMDVFSATGSVLLGAGVDDFPQAARANTMTSARSNAIVFFIFCFLSEFSLHFHNDHVMLLFLQEKRFMKRYITVNNILTYGIIRVNSSLFRKRYRSEIFATCINSLHIFVAK
jgi:hypothetical protein